MTDLGITVPNPTSFPFARLPKRLQKRWCSGLRPRQCEARVWRLGFWRQMLAGRHPERSPACRYRYRRGRAATKLQTSRLRSNAPDDFGLTYPRAHRLPDGYRRLLAPGHAQTRRENRAHSTHGYTIISGKNTAYTQVLAKPLRATNHTYRARGQVASLRERWRPPGHERG